MATSLSAKFYLDRERILQSCNACRTHTLSKICKAELETATRYIYKGGKHKESAKKYLGAIEEQLWEEWADLHETHLRRIKFHLMGHERGLVIDGLVKRIIARFSGMDIPAERTLSARRIKNKKNRRHRQLVSKGRQLYMASTKDPIPENSETDAAFLAFVDTVKPRERKRFFSRELIAREERKRRRRMQKASRIIMLTSATADNIRGCLSADEIKCLIHKTITETSTRALRPCTPLFHKETPSRETMIAVNNNNKEKSVKGKGIATIDRILAHNRRNDSQRYYYTNQTQPLSLSTSNLPPTKLAILPFLNKPKKKKRAIPSNNNNNSAKHHLPQKTYRGCGVGPPCSWVYST